MNIDFFIDQIQGKWIIQRTIYYLKTNTIKNFKEEFVYKKLNKNDAAIHKLLDFTSQYYHSRSNNISPICIYKNNLVSKYNIYFHDPTKSQGILSTFSHQSKHLVNYFYDIDRNNCILLSYRKNNLIFSEKTLWISNNLRNTISSIRTKDKLLSVSFASEIKINQHKINGIL